MGDIMIKVGLTGNIGSGKDTVTDLLYKKCPDNIVISDSDKICRELWASDGTTEGTYLFKEINPEER